MHVLHWVTLGQLGGVERHLAAFLEQGAASGVDAHGVLLARGGMHPLLRAAVERDASWIGRARYLGPQRLPEHPPGLRAWNRRRLVRRARPDVGLLWRRLGDLETVRLLEACQVPAVYWEHGSSWFPLAGDPHAEFFASVRGVVCNSFAARRMLEERFGYRGSIAVCLNAVPGEARVATPRPPLGSRRVRLGMAGRLRAFKGFHLALHALRDLCDRGYDVELSVAGEGERQGELSALTERLGLAERVRWLGLVDDMARFFRSIDIYVHPALREPFGLVVAEAARAGLPAVVARVDGLPEVVAEGVSGRTVRAEHALEHLGELGVAPGDLPVFQYDPEGDRVRRPRFVDPRAFADVVAEVIDDAEQYARLSRGALERFDECFGMQRHYESVISALQAFARPLEGALS